MLGDIAIANINSAKVRATKIPIRRKRREVRSVKRKITKRVNKIRRKLRRLRNLRTRRARSVENKALQGKEEKERNLKTSIFEAIYFTNVNDIESSISTLTSRINSSRSRVRICYSPRQ